MDANTNTSEMSEIREPTDDELDAVNGGSIANYTNALTAVIAGAFAYPQRSGGPTPLPYPIFGD